MSTSITERAAIVLQQIDAALALAEKATPGPWESEGDSVFIQQGDGFTNGVAQTLSGDLLSDAAFITSARTLLPTSLRCLKVAIEGLLPACGYWVGCAEALTALLDQWEAAQ